MTKYFIRQTEPKYFEQITKLCSKVYPETPPWNETQLQSHYKIFPEGQLLAINEDTKAILGYAASLIIDWDDYDMDTSWLDFTDKGMFTNHNKYGHTLYGAEIMVDPDLQGKGVGSLLYKARFSLVHRLKLLRIRAGARLRGYQTYAKEMTPEEYVVNVVNKKIYDPTLSFQIKREFKVLGVTSKYLRFDPESMGYAAIIEWLNPEVATKAHYQKQMQSKYYAD
jgi:GNAT superfamily N-acetyltransferase